MAYRPLADEIRPQTLDEVVGQRHILGENGVLRRIIEGGNIPNMVFYGPTGTGKTVAFGIPILSKVDPASLQPQAVVLSASSSAKIKFSIIRIFSSFLFLCAKSAPCCLRCTIMDEICVQNAGSRREAGAQ